jgi:hypothetical protein
MTHNRLLYFIKKYSILSQQEVTSYRTQTKLSHAQGKLTHYTAKYYSKCDRERIKFSYAHATLINYIGGKI